MTRKYVILISLLAGLALATNASAQFSHIKNIVGSDHDLSISGTNARGGNTVAGGTLTTGTPTHGTDTVTAAQICYYCHSPHQSSSANLQPPLWNHTLSSQASYGVYSSPTFNGLGTDIADVGGATVGTAVVTNLCLSCHDGTIAINNLISGVYTSGGSVMPDAGAGAGVPVYLTSATITTLTRIHPVNFTYDSTLAGKVLGLAVPTQSLGSAGSLAGNLYVVPAKGTGSYLPLFATPVSGSPGGAAGVSPKMQCATCHDVHDNTTNSPFLRDTLTGSQLCLDCHGAS